MAPIVRLSESQIRYLTDVDHNDHEALHGDRRGGGRGVGVARFVRLGEGSDTAEAAVIVVDPWQGAGLGKALSVMLSERARGARHHPLRGDAADGEQGDDGAAPSRWARSGRSAARALRSSSRSSCPETGIGDGMAGVLRVAATGDVEVMPETAELGLPG